MTAVKGMPNGLARCRMSTNIEREQKIPVFMYSYILSVFNISVKNFQTMMKFIEERKIPLSIAMFLVFFLINHNVNEKSSIFSKKKS